jgi:hypothetical protein
MPQSPLRVTKKHKRQEKYKKLGPYTQRSLRIKIDKSKM